MRDIVPAATASLTLVGEHSTRDVTLTTVLPMAWPAQVSHDGRVMVAAQTTTSSGDVSRDIGDALEQALSAESGTAIPPRPLPSEAPQVQELVDVTAGIQVIVRSSFDYWLDDGAGADAATRTALERANSAVMPVARLATVEAAFWMQLGDRRQLRWVLAESEDVAIDALARMQVDGGLGVGDASRYLGSFRSLGLLVPVWDLAEAVEVDDVEDPAAAFHERLGEALSNDAPLTGAQRRARESLLAIQLTMH
jgi:hypothetical protein